MTVYKAGLPVLAPPGTTPTPEPHDDHPGTGIDSSSRKLIMPIPEWALTILG